MSCGDWWDGDLKDLENLSVTKEESLDEFVQRLTAQIEAVKARADLATRLLCELMQQIDDLPYGSRRGLGSPEMNAWWAEHKKLDAKREKKTIRCGRKVRPVPSRAKKVK